MLAEMKVALGPAQPQLAVPESAVVYEDAVAHVWVVTDAKQLQYRRIETGAREDGVVVVTKGLHEHERIVTRGGLFIDRSVDPSVSTP
jgi:multidrug efflux pump subunit AcrA (membrane-fusion protein)